MYSEGSSSQDPLDLHKNDNEREGSNQKRKKNVIKLICADVWSTSTYGSKIWYSGVIEDPVLALHLCDATTISHSPRGIE